LELIQGLETAEAVVIVAEIVSTPSLGSAEMAEEHVAATIAAKTNCRAVLLMFMCVSLDSRSVREGDKKCEFDVRGMSGQ
jgi:hypothetical protein